MRNAWSIIVHGGAKTIPPECRDASRRGVLAAAQAGQTVLENGGTAIDAVVAAIRLLEDNPTFNAGYGSVLNSDGDVELDAALMDGEYLDVGSVAAVRGVKNPIDLAKAMLLDKPVLLVGDGAARYGAEKNVALCDPNYHKVPDVVTDPGCDTVGCVAYDRRGHIAAGSSTGGLSGVRPGRVGDAPIPGCGLYAEDNLGGVAFSGDGESIIRLALAGRLMSMLATLTAGQAATKAINQMERVGGEAGCIVIDANGSPDFAHNSDHFAVAMASHDQDLRAFLQRSEYAHD